MRGPGRQAIGINQRGAAIRGAPAAREFAVGRAQDSDRNDHFSAVIDLKRHPVGVARNDVRGEGASRPIRPETRFLRD